MPPEAPEKQAGTMPPAVSVCLKVMQNRPDFLAAARAGWRSAKGLSVQARDRGDDDPTIRIGYTCSKKVGNAVARNRAKRRLREIARMILPTVGKPGWDYVLIGRANATADRDFLQLQNDLHEALKKLHAEP